MRRGLAIAALMLILPLAAAQSCSIAPGPTMNLGTYTGTVSNSGVIPLTVTCTSGLAYYIGTNSGTHDGGTAYNWRMTSGSNFLSYKLYQDSARTQYWGGSQNYDSVAGIGTGSAQTYSMYPQTPGGQYPAPGTYNDTVILLLHSSAPTVSTTIPVTAVVQAACTISATAMVFGIYTGAQRDINSNVTVTCTNTTTWYVNLNDGNQPGGGYVPRMTGPGGALLSYSKFRDVARTQYWGNTYNLDGIAGTGNGIAQSLTAYDRIFANQYVQPGLYTDTIIAKVQF